MRILIVGGGTAGTIVANNLARRLGAETRAGKVRITLLSASDRHMYQPGLLYVAFGHMTPDQLYRDQASLLEPNIDFHVDPVTKFNLDKNQVLTAGGKTHDYDILVIATGSRMVPEETPGLTEGAEFFYTEASAVKMFKRLREFQGGKVVVAVGVPHKCPIAPVEVMFMLHDYFKARGIRDKVQLKYHYPIGRIHTIENVAIWAKPEFERIGVETETLFNIKEVDVKNNLLKSEEDTEVAYDLLIVIPQHRGMEVLETDNLGEGGWIPTDRFSLAMKGRDNVYVVGDTTNLPVSKTGSAAHFQAETLAENIASIVKIGAPVRDYDGKVYCFIEAGHDRATYAMFNYQNPPDLKPPSKPMHWFKLSYNQMYWTSVRGLL
ncbi:FAD/NAD(P)-binding oxidoreductase [Sulfuritalea sp.]|uniref:NAD(P)/FAD-dependent oxidoreductase n=1 Tax=Sulfuritalea sp. TaxID=2480090 RepID=UPI001AC5D7BC|nr:FAD/NAD(P)-binding oxidoreductase [Sulfuritalea sp.]MBN8475178.1 NAD(P)/FAD-dependent oxidoreductase [Sulfuritalea sp.]